MSSKISLYDSLGNPFELTGDMVKELVGIDSKQLATAWVNFDGATGAIRDSYNVSSVTRISAGEYDITFTTPMDNTNFSVAGSTEVFFNDNSTSVPRTVNTVRVRTLNTANAPTDYSYTNVQIFGGKA